MKLTRAQIVGMYGLAMNMPTDTVIEVISKDTAGHIIIEARSDSTERTARFKVPTHGGVQNLDA